ncbi:DNA-binding transcriptional regulator, GntR family [Alkalithermobacter thermoalcaliphilus JW-YL-7 = DSM 7308]|uniref:DNA-binding transcriptional regulator, GntR family n=1 Tax=Alkalithermobacter thermoalcaliphilus JW-YL-7 = DSM 7308 TaxID=1121328 RepID=A0A150FMV3_CLOPD|nr:transcriptional regulator, GntR family with FCD sensor domain containing protein [[Clostridium] paradoxum JW-YL-7 = DSM 7308]SHL21803.1 DNA-binding transcriptional regulator, GntR family [[Clostridium] paradoxum JW-YL-7 = DSM 7308]
MDDKLEKLKLENYKPLREIVFEHIREAILTGKLKPGQRLMEVQLAEQLGVSRTPVRETIRKLELEGLVVMIPRKGAYVADVSLKDIIEVLEIRSALEGLAASLAADRMSDEDIEKLEIISYQFKDSLEKQNLQQIIEKDVEFHDLIFQSTNNQKLIQMNNSLREQVHRFRITYISDFDTSKDLLKEHKHIVEAIINRDSESAMKYAMHHIENAQNFIIERFRKKNKV